MESGPPRRDRGDGRRPWCWLALAHLALVMTPAWVDAMLPQEVEAESADPIGTPLDEYCRVRRDVRSEWQPILSHAGDPSIEPLIRPIPPGDVPPPSRCPPAPAEHHSSLSRRSRAPGA